MSHSPASSASKRIVLLFLHAGSFNKECWKPIIRRLQHAPLLQRVPCEIASFDWRFHGDKRDRSIAPKLWFRNGDKKSPRVDHPLVQWTDWAPKDLFEEVKKLREDDSKLSRRTHVVGIGHSIGATSLMKVETTNPGTFDGIIAFEPVYNDGSITPEGKESVLDMLVGVTISREGEWDSWDAVLNHVKTARNFQRWHPESVEAFLENGVEKTEDGKRYRLVVSPLAEGAIYNHDFLTFRAEDFAKANCQIVVEHAEKTPFFRAEPNRAIAKKLPGKFVVADVIPKTTHSLTLEDPETCATHILDNLSKFPLFQAASVASKL